MAQQESLWSSLAPVAKTPAIQPVVQPPAQSEVDSYLFSLAEEFEITTVNYCKAICSGSVVNGVRSPATSVEEQFISRHARVLLSVLQKRAAEKFCLSPGAVNAAIRDYKAKKRYNH